MSKNCIYHYPIILSLKRFLNNFNILTITIVLCQEEDDLPYEEEILRNPHSVKCWLRYVEHKKDASSQQRNLIYERALKELPGR